jgi:hypothetical protein
MSSDYARKSIMYAGMDQHKESIELAAADRRAAAGCQRAFSPATVIANPVKAVID